MEIVQYDNRYAQDFVALNTAWIVGLFGQLEKEDIETFQNIEREIVNGGMIYFATENDEVMATCMTRHIGNEIWEICKLAANEKYKGKGAGNAVFEQCMTLSSHTPLQTQSSLLPVNSICKRQPSMNACGHLCQLRK